MHLFKTDSDYESDDIPNIYGSILRENKTYPKLMKISLPRDKNGNFDFVIFNKQKEQLTINNDDKLVDTLCKGKIFKGIIECAKIWYFKGRFGTTWNLTQLKFVENNSSTDIDAVNQNTSQAHVYMMLDD